MKTENEIPRRNRIDKNTEAELAIFNAIQAVEKAGASPMLTDVVVMLSKAKDKLSDFVDGIQPPAAQQATSKSLDECKNEVASEYIDKKRYSSLSLDDQALLVDKCMIKYASQFQQTHPQDSSSGEAESILKSILEIEQKNYEGRLRQASVHNNTDGVGIHFDYISATPMPEWAIKAEKYFEKQKHQSPPTSESNTFMSKDKPSFLEEAEKFVDEKTKDGTISDYQKSESLEEAQNDFWNYKYGEYGLSAPDHAFDELDKYIVDAIFKAGWDAAQQQKPLSFVLPTDDDIKAFAEKSVSDTNGMKSELITMIFLSAGWMRQKIQDQLSAANGVDPVLFAQHLIENWRLNPHESGWFWRTPKQVKDQVLTPGISTYEVYKLYLEQLQQQNKGNG